MDHNGSDFTSLHVSDLDKKTSKPVENQVVSWRVPYEREDEEISRRSEHNDLKKTRIGNSGTRYGQGQAALGAAIRLWSCALILT